MKAALLVWSDMSLPSSSSSRGRVDHLPQQDPELPAQTPKCGSAAPERNPREAGRFPPSGEASPPTDDRTPPADERIVLDHVAEVDGNRTRQTGIARLD